MGPPPPPPPPLTALPSPPETPEAALPQQSPGDGGFSFPRPTVRVTSEYDSDSQVFFHRVSCRLVDSLAKLRISFMNNRDGEISCPMLRLDLGKRLSLDYDVEAKNALLRDLSMLARTCNFRLIEKRGEVTMTTTLVQPSYKLALASAAPFVGLPRARFEFPLGEVSVEEREDDQARTALSMNGILKGEILSGVCTAQYEDTNLKERYSDKNLKLRYCFKDEQMTFIPEISLPYNAVSMTFKRQFSPSDKLSYCYHFHSNDFNAVYKRTIGENVKLKVGYDSEVRLGWASLWVGDEDGKTKVAPMKMKVQLMVQAPQDDFLNPLFMFRVKKRWDF
ncbi:unnamed protein product [Spirodela intermedia]|uniref:Uncharacterized protein n=1 Tax=Spirodela intermedia TaxID=51605 RepID=A0A7I8J1P7_SPIIN|nr:unnamed protein product [Spirodela intermedia]CAA6663892.1 unnamed protein product [Spirodela intermedia]